MFHTDYSNYRDYLNLAERWYSAADANASEEVLTNLYEDTEKAAKFIEEYSNDNSKEISNLCQKLIKDFNNPKKLDSLAKWISNHTEHVKNPKAPQEKSSLDSLFDTITQTANQTLSYFIIGNTDNTKIKNQENLSGAYPHLHHLFNAISQATNHTFDASIAEIDTKSLQYLFPPFPNIPQEMTDVIYYQMTPQELIKRSQGHDYDREIAINTLIKKINAGMVNLRQIGSSIQDIIGFFGKEGCREITKLDLREFRIRNDDVKEIFDNFKNINHLSLKKNLYNNIPIQITDASTKYLEQMTSLKSIHLEDCNKIKDFSFLERLENLTSLDLTQCYKIEDFSFLERLENLTRVNLRGCSKVDPSIINNLRDKGVNVEPITLLSSESTQEPSP